MTRVDAGRLLDPSLPLHTGGTGQDALMPCPYDVDGIAACPWNRPRQLAEGHRSRVDCRYFQLRATPRGVVATCSRPAG